MFSPAVTRAPCSGVIEGATGLRVHRPVAPEPKKLPSSFTPKKASRQTGSTARCHRNCPAMRASGRCPLIARDQSGGFGSKPYAHEELVAEMASAFTCASLSIQPTVRHADYIGSWLAVLREDDRAIFRAASAASKAANSLLGRTPSDQHAEDKRGSSRSTID